MIEKIIKIVLAILFFVCLADMPYGYFQLVRFSAMIGFGILAYYSFHNKKNIESIIFIALIILFQPLIKIPLGRTIWNIVDVIVGVALILSIWIRPKSQH